LALRIQDEARVAQLRLRNLPRDTKMKLGACVAALALLVGGLLLRGTPPQQDVTVRVSDAAATALADVPRPPPVVARKSYAAGKTDEKKGEYKAAAQAYATAARKGDARGLSKLVAMTHAKSCEARSEAADALGTLHGKAARKALQKLAKRSDAQEPHGLFNSCNSRNAAQKALEAQRRG
jgi:hypothetical protein